MKLKKKKEKPKKPWYNKIRRLTAHFIPLVEYLSLKLKKTIF